MCFSGGRHIARHFGQPCDIQFFAAFRTRLSFSHDSFHHGISFFIRGAEVRNFTDGT